MKGIGMKDHKERAWVPKIIDMGHVEHVLRTFESIHAQMRNRVIYPMEADVAAKLTLAAAVVALAEQTYEELPERGH